MGGMGPASKAHLAPQREVPGRALCGLGIPEERDVPEMGSAADLGAMHCRRCARLATYVTVASL